ncbi:hypothetical protein E1J06_27200 [Phocaeicola dorei]|uniref:Uncharacterized protein n=1 Tax=Phocaeicola dorei TaxID=357276 RepID=A0AAX2QU61_9BACT|nr:hypothetical protein E1J06_27200 [Phocaeicola dorei]
MGNSDMINNRERECPSGLHMPRLVFFAQVGNDLDPINYITYMVLDYYETGSTSASVSGKVPYLMQMY